MNRNLLVLTTVLGAITLSACGSATPPPQNTNNAGTVNASAPRPNPGGPVAAHDVPGGPGAPADAPRSPGGPSGDPIDTTTLDADIEKTEKAHQSKPNDAAATKALAAAYAARADALTEARQYRSALGDYRRSLKLDPGNQEARKMHDQIVGIFEQMGREVPAEGTEPPPMRK